MPNTKCKILTFNERKNLFDLLQRKEITEQDLKDQGLSVGQIARLRKEEPKRPKPKSKMLTFEQRTQYYNGLNSGAITKQDLINQGVSANQITWLTRKEPKRPRPHRAHMPYNSFSLEERIEFRAQLLNGEEDKLKEKRLSRRQIDLLRKKEPRPHREHKKYKRLTLETKKEYRIQLETGITTEEALKSEGISDWQIKTIRQA
ncbi:hypothetical protein D5R81_19030 [Parashewanella spongiae]|uniref:Uncharacterized protein n=1 Tax=Parashewanella spongiae TaxID=342950 RepID=A0A3A6TDQ8_9GAMM|nr:hypothetical protein [Parashewanella spongiae]MCL1080229.1 hypothetical protein [Parashewanella spongiae]RJY04910.1 hypothetical protein D5R81_19030 [Parashewanella spongiae]